MKNARAPFVDKSVVVDQGLVTSRNYDDIPDFIDEVLQELAEGALAGQTGWRRLSRTLSIYHNRIASDSTPFFPAWKGSAARSNVQQFR